MNFAAVEVLKGGRGRRGGAFHGDTPTFVFIFNVYGPEPAGKLLLRASIMAFYF